MNAQGFQTLARRRNSCTIAADPARSSFVPHREYGATGIRAMA
jgi:hypothetical protein